MYCCFQLNEGHGLRLAALRILAALICSAAANAQSQIAIVSPAANTKVSGKITFSVQFTGLSNVAGVAYKLNGKPLYDGRDEVAPVSKAPYDLAWNTKSTWDGSVTVQAIAQDAAGRPLAASPIVPFQIMNKGVSVTLMSPDPARPLSGHVNWSLQQTGIRSSESLFWLCMVDGKSFDPQFVSGSHYSMPLDTTSLTNGPHEVACSVWSESRPNSPPLGLSQVTVNVNNNRTPMELRSGYNRMFLSPGGRMHIAPTLVYTNGDQTAAPASFTTSNPSVASVDSNGNVTAIGPGTATIGINSGKFSASSVATVVASNSFPHFSKTGGILSSYQPGVSTFVRSIFRLSPSEIDHTPGLAAEVQRAGVNALTVGLYQNPADNPGNSLAAWIASTDDQLNSAVKTARSIGASLFFTGDDMTRSPEELTDTITDPNAPVRIRHVFDWATQCKCAIGVDMLDEADGVWGDTPTPVDGRWAPIPDNSLIRVMDMVNASINRLPVSWPIGGWSSDTEVMNWLDDSRFSGYASLYWSSSLSYRPGYPYSFSLGQNAADITGTIDHRASLLHPMPMLMLTSASGPFYNKNSSGSQYNVGSDLLLQTGESPSAVQAQIMMAVEKGMAGVRVYQYDSADMKQQRQSLPLGSGELETGSGPFLVGTARWSAISGAFNLIKTIEPFVLQPQMHALDLGPDVYTGAKSGSTGNLFAVTSISEVPQTVTVPLTGYALGKPGTRYTLSESASSSSPISALNDTVTLLPGGSVVYVFPR